MSFEASLRIHIVAFEPFLLAAASLEFVPEEFDLFPKLHASPTVELRLLVWPL